ncbi:chemotaxis protein CheW [Inmirania thermothiophila]|uniref:Purine-binding chemotaxis protein CheW n=1 Tax=Inmirania thermothiophila TaxID=1750597 RepID=A0A3N1Y105_9GAMM|nr:chemotaxis protein CheW [Inmirania thermothiophila]ROR32519.1 purine-binding chemotaxis protein CheW [Inmirania thermothiophila]
MSGERAVCVFHVGDHCCGVDAVAVQEVLSSEAITPLPLMPPELVGLINLRGEIVPVLDAHRLLEVEGGPGEVHLVLRAGGEHVSLLVDRVEEVVAAPEGAFEEAPPTVGGRLRDFVLGTYKLEGSLLLMLDAGRIGALRQADLAAAGRAGP